MKIKLPSLDSEYLIPEEKINFFWENGFVVLKNVLSKEEIGIYREEIKKVSEERMKNQDKSFGGAFYQALNIRFDSKGVEKYCLSKRLGKIAADLMKVNAVRIFHEQAIFKNQGDTKSYWHQDQYFWPLNTNLHIGMWMALSDMTKDMGLMKFVIGSHKKGDLDGISITKDSEKYYENLIKKENLNVYELESIYAGDCTFHFNYTIHGAGLNISNKVREAMVVTYYEDGAKLRKLDKMLDEVSDSFLGGKKEGEIADHSMNPIVYKR